MYRFLEMMKQSALETYDSSKPANVVFGKVVSVSPLEVQIDAKKTLTEEFLILTSNVRDVTVPITLHFSTDSAAGGEGYGAYQAHSHGINGKTVAVLHQGLNVGDVVVMIRAQGGQKYVVLDKGGV